MLKNYLIIAIRNIFRDPFNSIINIFGLAMGMACFILIMLWVKDELNYDKFHENYNNIYRFINERNWIGNTEYAPSTPGPLGEDMKQQYPEIKSYTMFFKKGYHVKTENKEFFENEIAFVDSSFFKIFSTDFIDGDRNTVFRNINSVVITESIAKKYYANKNPINKILLINNDFQVKIDGVIKDTPANSHISYKILLPVDNLNKDGYHFNYYNYPFNTYVLLKENTNYKAFNKKIAGFMKKIPSDRIDEAGQNSRFFLQPLKKIYLHSYHLVDDNKIIRGDIRYIYIFSLTALFILFIACINFINISLSFSIKRSKEIGLRKSIGANRISIIKQYIGENIPLILIAYIFCIIIVELVLPYFNSFISKKIDITYTDIKFIISILCFLIITIIISGFYPAFYLSKLKPVKTLKSNYNFNGNRFSVFGFRKITLLTQYIISVSLIICFIVINNQLKLLHTKKLGLTTNQIVYFNASPELINRYNSFKTELSKNPNIIHISLGSLPTRQWNCVPVEWSDEDNIYREGINMLYTGEEYLKTFNIELLSGREILDKDNENNYLLNQKAVNDFNIKSPIGKQISVGGNRGEIVGIVDNFHYKSLHTELEPLILSKWRLDNVFVKISRNDFQKDIGYINMVWDRFFPSQEFEYKFVDEAFNQLYTSEDQMVKIFKVFSLLAVLISCLGLLSLSLLTLQARIKEIGIRKVNGARILEVMTMLNKDFVKWVIIAFVIATPVSYYAMHKWLENFAYKTELSWWIFAVAGIMAIGIALLTVSFQSWRTASRNPVEALRYE